MSHENVDASASIDARDRRRRASVVTPKTHPRACVSLCVSLVPRTGTHRHAPFRLALRDMGEYGSVRGANPDGPYWARTSDLRLVEPALSQLS
jgi:hypothetical protein